VCNAINNNLLSEFIPTPNQCDWKRIAKDFWTMCNFPNCLGALDGKHVVIESLAKSGSLYFNYKKTFSIVLLALVDANYRFISVDVGSYGKNSDSGIFGSSKLGKTLFKGKLNLPDDAKFPGSDIVTPYVIVGDEAFPLTKNLMRPFPGTQTHDIEKRIFNYRLSRARRLVECAFGILTQTFRFYTRRLKSDPNNATSIILTTCILYNIIRKHKANFDLDETFNESSNENRIMNLKKHGGNAQTEAFIVRNNFKRFFNSPAGAVPWQMDKI